MHGPWFQSMVREDPTCRRTAKPVHHNCWSLCSATREAHTLQWRVAPAPCNYRETMQSNIHPAKTKLIKKNKEKWNFRILPPSGKSCASHIVHTRHFGDHWLMWQVGFGWMDGREKQGFSDDGHMNRSLEWAVQVGRTTERWIWAVGREVQGEMKMERKTGVRLWSRFMARTKDLIKGKMRTSWDKGGCDQNPTFKKFM